MPKSHPFPYLGEGVASARKVMSVFVAFARTAKTKAALAKLPSIFGHVTWHTPTLLEVAHVGELQWAVARTYPKRGPRAEEGEATTEQWRAFNLAIDRWLLDIHATQPIAFAIKPADDEYGTSFGAWHAWSSLEAGPSLWPLIGATLPKKLSAVVDWVIDRWRDDLAELPPKQQEQRLAKLDAKARTFLKRRGGVPDVVHPAPKQEEPSLGALLEVWRSLRGKDGDREEQFRHALDVPVDEPNPSLWGLAFDLAEANRYEELADVCVDALRGPVEYRDHWTDMSILALARAKRFDEARARLRDALFHASLYGAQRLMVGLILLLEHDEREEDACAVFHGAAKKVVSFASSAKQCGLDPKRYGKSRAALLRRFAQIWDEIVRPGLDVGAIPDMLLWNAETNLREVGCIALADEVARESARRAGPVREETPSDVARVPLLAKPAGEATEDDFARALKLLPSLDELQRKQLLDWAYEAVGDSRERGYAIYRVLPHLAAPKDGELREDWLSSLNNAAVMTWRRKDFELSRALVEAAQPFAHENPAIFHAAACTYVSLGELDRAFAQVELAVKHRYEELGQLKRDTDLGELRTWPKFKALFASRRS